MCGVSVGTIIAVGCLYWSITGNSIVLELGNLTGNILPCHTVIYSVLSTHGSCNLPRSSKHEKCKSPSQINLTYSLLTEGQTIELGATPLDSLHILYNHERKRAEGLSYPYISNHMDCAESTCA